MFIVWFYLHIILLAITKNFNIFRNHSQFFFLSIKYEPLVLYKPFISFQHVSSHEKTFFFTYNTKFRFHDIQRIKSQKFLFCISFLWRIFSVPRSNRKKSFFFHFITSDSIYSSKYFIGIYIFYKIIIIRLIIINFH